MINGTCLHVQLLVCKCTYFAIYVHKLYDDTITFYRLLLFDKYVLEISLYHNFFRNFVRYKHKYLATMAKIKVIQLTDQQRLQLEEGFRQGKSHAYRMRCRAVLLKSAGLTSEQVGFQTEMSHISVNSWVKRFEAEGIKGLKTRPGRGRKPIMDSSDEEAVRIAIENDRQSVKKAKEAWQQASGKEASESTFRSFLSALARDIDV